ncbi:ribonuclease HII [Candidatus Kaiserbacteria bacterium]|nr:ribonuclease HII [Candidatus Kaiserbacteria bacterium]
MKHIVGVDEAGRGPLAGPVSVGVACVFHDFDWSLLPGVTDSKKLSEKRREEIFIRAKKLKRDGVLDYRVAMVHANSIDTRGINPCIRSAIQRAFRGLNLDPKETDVRLDGLLYAPKAFEMQQTIIKGDAKEKVIGLASILAKVTRDRYMVRISKQYAEYDFHIHKGYGTKKHREAILENGVSDVHRRSYCRGLIS